MKRAIPLLLALLAATMSTTAGAVVNSQDDGKVTQSRNADVGEYPGQVGLLKSHVADNHQAQYCGGTQIHPSWVLTAAHCLHAGPGTGLPHVLIGTNRLDGSGIRVATVEAFEHPQFQFPSNDIAVLRLETPTAAPLAELAYVGMATLETPGTPAVVTGWGGLSSDEDNQSFPDDLQEGDVPVISDDQCDAAVNEHGDDVPDASKATIVCAGTGTMSSSEESVDACRGDSGGPLWARGPDGVLRQIGLVSGGPTCGFSPTYYSAVESFIGFIETMTHLNFASFVDIPGGTHERNIERVVLGALAGGFPDGTYRPNDSVSRGQMARFIANALGLPDVADGPFTDVDGTTHEGAINAIAQAGIVGGFSDGTYRPGDPVTRGQMATFLANAIGLEGVEQDQFTDIASSAHRTDINAVAIDGIAGGIGDGTYRPDAGVTRGQMATFLANAFLA